MVLAGVCGNGAGAVHHVLPLYRQRERERETHSLCSGESLSSIEPATVHPVLVLLGRAAAFRHGQTTNGPNYNFGNGRGPDISGTHKSEIRPS